MVNRILSILRTVPAFLLCLLYDNAISVNISHSRHIYFPHAISSSREPRPVNNCCIRSTVGAIRDGLPSFAFLAAGLRSLPHHSIASTVKFRRGTQRDAIPRSKPPDISSALLNERTIFIGYPIQAEVAQLVIAQLLYLDHASQKPITIYINSDDTPVNEDPLSSCDIYALNIVDVMSYVKSDIITVNLGKAYGPAALILASGTPGKRLALPNSFTALRQSAVSLELMPAADICIYSKEILKARRQMICMLARCCGKGEDDVLQTIQRGCYMGAQQAVEYGLVDKIIDEYAVN